MEPNNNPTPTEASASVAEPTNQETLTKSKSSKSLTWCFAILAIIGIAAAAVFAYLYFTSPTTSPTPTPAPVGPEIAEEIEITDTLLKKDLDEKIAILHGVYSTEPTFMTGHGIHQEYPLYDSGDLSDGAKLAKVAYSLSNQSHYLNDKEVAAIISEKGYSSDMADIIRNSIQGINGNIFRKKYIDVFGKEPVLNQDSTKYCPLYLYDAELDFFYLDPDSGCGGTSSYENYYYKNSYRLAGDKAYVYVSVGTHNLEDDKIYCDIIFKSDDPLPDVCDANPDLQSFTINGDNYQDYTNYRFVFNKADDGTYYFEQVEKL